MVATARELGDAAVAPDRFALFSDRQYAEPGLPVPAVCTSDSRIAWVEGRSLPDGGPAFLPAELVYLGRATLGGSEPIGYSTSSGLACDESDVVATVEGAFEILERDAFMLVWSNRLSLPLLDRVGARCSTAPGLGYAAVDLSLDPSDPVRARRRPRPGRDARGARGRRRQRRRRVERAWWKALAEAFSARTAGVKLALLDAGRRRAARSSLVRRPHPPVRGSPARGEHRRSSTRAPSGSRWTRCRRSRARAREELLAALCGRIGAAGSSAYAVDVTAPDVAELGLTVAKVVAPELCALDTAHSARFLGGRRLYEAASRARARARADRRRRAEPRPAPVPVTRVRADRAVRVDRLRPGRRRRSTTPPSSSTRPRASTRMCAPPRLEVLLGSSHRAASSRRRRRARAEPTTIGPGWRFPRLGPCAAGSATCSPGGGPTRVEALRSREPGRPLDTPCGVVCRTQARRGAAPAGSVGRRALSARALCRRPRRNGSRDGDLPLRPVPAPAGPARADSLREPARGGRRSGARRQRGGAGVVTGVFWRSRFKYGPRGYRFALLEAGHLVQNALLAADRPRAGRAAARRLPRPPARRARRSRRPRRGVAVRGGCFRGSR